MLICPVLERDYLTQNHPNYSLWCHFLFVELAQLFHIHTPTQDATTDTLGLGGLRARSEQGLSETEHDILLLYPSSVFPRQASGPSHFKSTNHIRTHLMGFVNLSCDVTLPPIYRLASGAPCLAY